MTDHAGPARWRKIEAVLDGALDLPPDRRAAYLDEACAGDPPLRAEVESLLSAHASASGFLESPIASLRAALAGRYKPDLEVGPYRLLRELGRGGLGVVFLAVDTRLGRKVALKLLPASRVADPEARARFLQEARAASALDHPNICTVYDIGESPEGDPYIAMAYIEGERLADRIARGPLPLREAVNFAIQAAGALAHAHGHGVVHRDIKPANLIVTPSGGIVVVDFGLARLQGASTLTRPGTMPGTAAYMSPEQVEGRDVDHRADIWALGVVLYEMITGRPPFRGEDDHARMYAIVNAGPEPLTALRADIPLALEPVVAKALAKDPDRRYQNVDELPVDLRSAVANGPDHVPGHVSGRVVGARWTAAALLSAGIAAGALAATQLLDGSAASAPREPTHLTITLPSGHGLVQSAGRRLAISPDGRQLVYGGHVAGHEQLWIRALDQPTPRPIAGTRNARNPFFSPDGRWVGFFAEGELRRVSLDGGPAWRIAHAPTQTNRGAAWMPDGTIVLSLGQLSGLYRVDATGGEVRAVAALSDEPGASAHMFPQALPDGRRVLFTIWRPSGSSIGLLDLEAGDWEEIDGACFGAHFVPTGHVLCREIAGVSPTGTVLAAPFSLKERRILAPPVGLPRPSDVSSLAVSESGTLVYATRESLRERSALTWVDRSGEATDLGDPGAYRTPAVSPDGSRVAVARFAAAGRQDLWLYDVARGTTARLSGVSPVSNAPLWSSDGETILFNTLRSPPGIYQMPWDVGDSTRLVLSRTGHIQVPGALSDDGSVLVYTELDDRTRGDIWTISLKDGSRAPLLHTPANERGPVLSPDGAWLAWASDESGRDEVYVTTFPEPGAPIQVSTNGGREPVWSRDGSELFYRLDNAVLAVPVERHGSFAAGHPVVLFEGRYASEYLGKAQYDVAPDGRFLMVRLESTPEPVQLDVVLDWFTELERRVPVRR